VTDARALCFTLYQSATCPGQNVSATLTGMLPSHRSIAVSVPVAVLGAVLVPLLVPRPAAALPTGYLVWSKGQAGVATSRKIYRMTLPEKSDVIALTSGEDVECQVSPDGKWVAYAKAKFGGSDYHNFKLWKLYIVSIHGVGGGRQEIKIDDTGAWPSWGAADLLYYNQADGTHSKIVRVRIDSHGKVTEKKVFFETKSAFASFTEVNECFVAPDASWFAARTRGQPSITGVGAYQINPPKHFVLARAGSFGCMPYVAPSGTWGLIAGAEDGIRWGHGPAVPNRKEDQLLVQPPSGSKAYHPGISTDEKWVLASIGVDDHNHGSYDVQIYPLDTTAMTVGAGEQLTSGEFNGWSHVWVGQPTPPPPPEPQILEFYPSSYTVAPAEQVTLTWSTNEADQVELDGAAVATDGTESVAPAATTTYTLVAKSSASSTSDTQSCTVTVNATPQPVTVESFEAEPETIEEGNSVTLSWVVKNPTTLDLDGQRIAPEGTLEVSPMETTTYVLTANGHQGPVTAEVTVTVEAISSGLLPDKGGFVCGLGSGLPPTLPGLALLLGLLLALRRRRR
jgi:hypothetical protein